MKHGDRASPTSHSDELEPESSSTSPPPMSSATCPSPSCFVHAIGGAALYPSLRCWYRRCSISGDWSAYHAASRPSASACFSRMTSPPCDERDEHTYTATSARAARTAHHTRYTHTTHTRTHMHIHTHTHTQHSRAQRAHLQHSVRVGVVARIRHDLPAGHQRLHHTTAGTAAARHANGASICTGSRGRTGDALTSRSMETSADLRSSCMLAWWGCGRDSTPQCRF